MAASGKDLGIKVETPFKLALLNGVSINADILVRGFGAKNGILIISDYSSVKEYANEGILVKEI